MSMDLLHDKIRKLKNPSIIDFGIKADSIPAHLLEEEGSLVKAYGRFCRELMTALKGFVPGVRFPFGAFALLGAEGIDLQKSLLNEAKEMGFYVLLDSPEILSPWAAAVYVTHDQEEAMAVSDRIAVMNGGVIQHIGTPKNIYQRPANLFVSTFIGRSNVMNGKLMVENGRTYVVTPCGYRTEMTNVKPEYHQSQDVIFSIRPEEFLLDRDSNAEGISATVDDCVFLGLMTHYFVHLESGEEVEIIQESSIDSIIEPGTKIKLTLNTDKVNIFTSDGSDNMLLGVCNDCEMW